MQILFRYANDVWIFKTCRHLLDNLENNSSKYHVFAKHVSTAFSHPFRDMKNCSTIACIFKVKAAEMRRALPKCFIILGQILNIPGRNSQPKNLKMDGICRRKSFVFRQTKWIVARNLKYICPRIQPIKTNG